MQIEPEGQITSNVHVEQVSPDSATPLPQTAFSELSDKIDLISSSVVIKSEPTIIVQILESVVFPLETVATNEYVPSSSAVNL